MNHVGDLNLDGAVILKRIFKEIGCGVRGCGLVSFG
jgi:hypothetical protein